MFFDLKHRDSDVDVSAFKHFSGLKQITLYSRFTSQTDSFDLNMIFCDNNSNISNVVSSQDLPVLYL